MIDIDIIMAHRANLDAQLKAALSTMDLKTNIFEIREAIKENQKICPHFSDKYNFTVVDGICPYCGAKINGVEE